MATHLKIKWPNHYIVVELCKSPVVEKWKLCIQDVIKNNAPPMITHGAPFYHAYGGRNEELQAKAVKEINLAINIFEKNHKNNEDERIRLKDALDELSAFYIINEENKKAIKVLERKARCFDVNNEAELSEMEEVINRINKYR